MAFRRLDLDSLASLLQLGWIRAVVTGVAMTSLVGLGQQSGLFQAAELAIHDHLVTLSPSRGQDPRLLLVAVQEADLQRYGYPLSDDDIAAALQVIQAAHPRVIGLDLYRDQPQGSWQSYEQLIEVLQDTETIVITKLPSLSYHKAEGPEQSSSVKSSNDGIAPPPRLREAQIGFNDILIDTSGVVRRQLLLAQLPESDELYYSFPLRIALKYLTIERLEIQQTALTLGQTVIPRLDASFGGYQGIDNNGFQTMIQYRTLGDGFPSISLTDVLTQNFTPDQVRDKVVLIGSTTHSLKDYFYKPARLGEPAYAAPLHTPDSLISGVELLGQMVSQLLDTATGDLLGYWALPDTVEVLLVLVWSLVGGLLALNTRAAFWIGVELAVSTLAVIGISYVALQYQGWIPAAAPVAGLLGSGGLTLAYQTQLSRRQQDMMMQLFGQNVSHEIAETLWQQRDQLLQLGRLPGQNIKATVLFADIRGFSTISERLQAPQLLDWLNTYFTDMTHEIHTHQGIINKFMGDGLMALFGVPVARLTEAEVAADARRAVRCALAMSAALDRLNQTWAQAGLPTAEIRIGVYTGSVVAGSIGGKSRLEYGVIGDGVNIASRLESYQKKHQRKTCRILIAQQTLDYVDGEFEVDSLGTLELRGKEKSVPVHRVRGYRVRPCQDP